MKNKKIKKFIRGYFPEIKDFNDTIIEIDAITLFDMFLDYQEKLNKKYKKRS